MKTKHQFRQGDLLFITLTDTGGNKYMKALSKGWLLITEVAVDGRVIQANYAPEGSKGYGGMIWPKFRVHLQIRGRHGHTSPFAAMQQLKRRSGLQAFVNEK